MKHKLTVRQRKMLKVLAKKKHAILTCCSWGWWIDNQLVKTSWPTVNSLLKRKLIKQKGNELFVYTITLEGRQALNVQ